MIQDYKHKYQAKEHIMAASSVINLKKTAITAALSKDILNKIKPIFEKETEELHTLVERLPGDMPSEDVKKVRFAVDLAAWADDNESLVKNIASGAAELKVASLRDMARKFSVSDLAKHIETAMPEAVSGETIEEKKTNYAITLHRKFYAAEPAAVLSRMAENNELPGMDNGLGTAVSKFLDNQPEFNIRKTSILTALAKEDAFKGIDDDKREKVADQLKKLQRVQAFSAVPETVPHLLKHNLTDSLRITAIPEATFVRNHAAALGEEVARSVHRAAAAVHVRNENILMAMRETVRGGGAMSLAGCCSGEREIRTIRMKEEFAAIAKTEAIPLSLDNLFGDMDYCECDECLSVYSPAAYFVELLQYLRHNNFGHDPENPTSNENPDITVDIKYTPLGALFERRPDLGCLELTCENTFTVMPYVDLVNEIMEHWVVNKAPLMPSFNVEDETSSELLAQPQHTNYRAYCELKKAVYPFTLPYHQAIDAARIWLNYMGTSRYELLDTFRRYYPEPAGETGCEQQQCEKNCSPSLSSLEAVAQDRAVDAEYLGMTQEDYIILTREAFWPKAYFELTNNRTYTNEEYQEKIGVRPVYEYYGYDTAGQLQDLTFVKKEFLPRTGIQYTDLVELLKTEWINPQFPKGKALKILESISFSYRFMQRLVDKTKPDPYAKLVQWLETAPQIIAFWESFREEPCGSKKKTCPIGKADIRQWVECYFERLGKLIVLESGQGPYLPVEGGIYSQQQLVGFLHNNGEVRDKDNEKAIGFVDCTFAFIGDNREIFDYKLNSYGYADKGELSPLMLAGPVRANDGSLLSDIVNDKYSITTKDDQGKPKVYYISRKGIEFERRLCSWNINQDSCDLEKVRLVHLDGTSLDEAEYDRIQRFIRLWQRTGWTIDETDKALIGLAAAKKQSGSDAGKEIGGQQQRIDFNAFSDTCRQLRRMPITARGCGSEEENLDCPEEDVLDWTITPESLHQLVAVKKLVERTGLPLLKLLTFWADISTSGEKSLYSQLFLTHNLLGIDKVFQADEHGNYLTGNARISEHLPVLMAALRLKADEIRTILPLSDLLTLGNVSNLYRHSLLAKLLHVKPELLLDVISLFGKPFVEAEKMLETLSNWTKIEDAGFSFSQINYLLQDKDDAQRPLAPTQKTVLQTAKTLYDGLNAIDKEHPDLKEDKEEDKDQASTEFVRAKAELIFTQDTVKKIISLLEGSIVSNPQEPIYPPSGLTVTIREKIEERLLSRITYKDQNNPPTLQVTGILTTKDMEDLKAVSAHSRWIAALEQADKDVKAQANKIINDVLYGIFPNNIGNAKAELLKGDDADKKTAQSKRLFFLKNFLPFLRRELARRLIVETMAGAGGLAKDVTETLLANILTVDSGFAMAALEQIKIQLNGEQQDWKGCLIPSANGEYTFVAISKSQPPEIVLDGLKISFPHQQEEPNDVWLSDPVRLNGGKLYKLETGGLSLTELQWKTAVSPRAYIPSSMLLPDHSSGSTGAILKQLCKAALLINNFGLNLNEVKHFKEYFNFNSLTLQHCLHVHAYVSLRSSLPSTETSLIDFFQSTDTVNSSYIVAVTGWKKEQIDEFIANSHLNLDHLEAFRNEIGLMIKMQKAIKIADKVGVSMDYLFRWANPTSKFSVCHTIAQDIQKSLRSRYDQEDWEKVVKPLNDQLREHQKQALINYLLVHVQEDLNGQWQILDADSLFEYFLIDVQMSPCFETSRIKQAISSVQLFVQRCLLGLEKEKDDKDHVKKIVLDRERWEWMQRYRVWEANRKVFLYPENWISSQLRDDKSPFYKELESELLQKDINQQTVEDALKSYLYKVDEVANLRVAGLFLEQEKGTEAGKEITVNTKLHIFARTRNAPYFFFYRFYDVHEENWYPWEKVQVDIPSYDHETADGQIDSNGTYLIPVVWNKRLLIFFPQFMKKTAPNPTERKFNDMRDSTPSENKPIEYWEIKMGWSEYRNGKWTQKQLSTEAIYDNPGKQNSLPDIRSYEFIPRVINQQGAFIDIHKNDKEADVSSFLFTGSKINTTKTTTPIDYNLNGIFHWYADPASSTPPADQNASILFLSMQTAHSLTDGSKLKCKEENGYATITVPKQSNSIAYKFYHQFSHNLLGKMSSGTLDDLFLCYPAVAPSGDTTYGTAASKYHELSSPYSLYNWEAAFHAPMLLVESLLNAQQFEQALKMCHYIFNPQAEDGNGADRFWKFSPFKEIEKEGAKNVLEDLFNKLQKKDDAAEKQVNEWRNKPFKPHVVARSRPTAYMKWVVMKYIEILIAWGDYLFRQDTIESINQATQLYVLASHVYGPRGYKIPKRGRVEPQTYLSLKDKWDAFSNAMIEMELLFPHSSNQTPSGGAVGFANIFGFASTLYFCIPDNPKIRELRSTIDDRLFKIRNCQNIEGVFRKLPLFEPPIDPALLVQAAAQGLSIASVLNDLNSPMPNYRFYYLLQKAQEMCSELKALGAAYLSAKEKYDGEAISQLRAKHESSIHALTMELRTKQLEEAQKSLEALYQNRKGLESRIKYYLQLIGEDADKVPEMDADFTELPNNIEKPVDESGLKLSKFEKDEMDKASDARDKNKTIGQIQTLANILHLIPQFDADAKPIGVGAGITMGGINLGNALQAIAGYMQIEASDLSYQSTNAGRKGGHQRQLQERIQQANAAGYEIKNLDRQILTQQIRINIAEQEIRNQQKQIDNAQEMEDFLRNKYTNQELYQWMAGQLTTLYRQAYDIAYNLAKKAESVYRFERGISTSNFLQGGYWDAGRDGLLAGERLSIALKQLEAAYQEKRGHDYEISNSFSLRRINPLALIELRETGYCEFALPEVLFDMNYPGHYMRRIKSVAMTVPCVVGPYTSLNCTLRLLEHKFRTSALAKGKNAEGDNGDFSTFNVPISSVALSSGQNDSGVFELNFKDERYLPFEGAGAISKWRIDLPEEFRQFDYDTISDVVLHLRYTALDGGEKLKNVAVKSVQQYVKDVEELSREEGLFAFFDLKSDFPTEWNRAARPAEGATERLIHLGSLNERLPYFTAAYQKNIFASNVHLFVSEENLNPSDIIIQGEREFTFSDEYQTETMKSFISKDTKGYPITDWTVKIKDMKTELNKMWMVIRYTLK